MIFILAILFPLFCLASLVYLISKKRYSGLLYSFVTFLACAGMWVWAISQSRSSTAAIGLLFVPLISSVSGFLIWAFFFLRSKPQPLLKAIAFFVLLGSVFLIGYGAYSGLLEVQIRADKARMESDIQRHYYSLQSQSKSATDPRWLEKELSVKQEDLAFQIAVARSSFADKETLAKLARYKDRTLLIAVARNENTSPDILQELFSRPDSSWLDSALAMNPSTPEALFMAVYKRSSYVGAMLAENPSVPKAVMWDLAHATDFYTLEKVVSSSYIDCDTLIEAEKSVVSLKEKIRDSFNENIADTIKKQKSKLCAVSQ